VIHLSVAIGRFFEALAGALLFLIARLLIGRGRKK
jgi:hypothetical protein